MTNRDRANHGTTDKKQDVRIAHQIRTCAKRDLRASTKAMSPKTLIEYNRSK